jgi:hypothetical protein
MGQEESGYRSVSADSEHDLHPLSNRIYKFGVLKFIFFNIFHIHALNDDSIYTIRPTNTNI